MYRTDFWTLWEKARVGCSERTALKQAYSQGWNKSPAQVGCMRQVLVAGALGRPRGMGWGGRWEGGSGWWTPVNPRLIHDNVWQRPLQYCKVISLQLIKINGKKEKEIGFIQPPQSSPSSKEQIQTVANQGREVMKKEWRNSQETIVQPWSRILVPPERIYITSLSSSAGTKAPTQMLLCCSVLSYVRLFGTPWTAGFPVPHHLLEFAQTHVHWLGDATQPYHPLSSPSAPAFNRPKHQGLFQWVNKQNSIKKNFFKPTTTYIYYFAVLQFRSLKWVKSRNQQGWVAFWRLRENPFPCCYSF